jgi:acyl-CoA synthetase (AMP-forming)/AMP-acid ligase II
MKACCNLGDILAEAAEERVALIDCRSWEAPVSYSYASLDRLANALARGLLRRGLARGSTVAILSPNRAEFLIAYLGALRAGLVAVPVNFRFSPEITAYILRDANVAFVLYDQECRAALPAGMAAADFDGAGERGFAGLLDFGPFSSVRPAPGEPAMLLYTSGSSGRPKGVLLSHDGQLWSVAHRASAGTFSDERLLIAAPLFHMNALGTAKFALAAGASLVLLPRFDARRYIAAIARFRATWLTGVPTMFALLLREREALAATDLSSVRQVRMGSAPVTQKLIDATKARFPRAAISLVYGTTESGPVTFAPHPMGRAKPDTALGWPARGVEARFLTAAMEAAGEGVLQVRTGAMMLGYANLPEQTHQALTPDGWYTTGDVFTRAADGCYSFAGRADDMINCGGENVFPAEVERLLLAHPDIAEAAVIGIDDELKGQKPMAFVVLKPGAQLSEEAVKRHVLANAPAFQHPRRVQFLAELPLAGTGKIDRTALRQLAQAEAREAP